MNKKGFTLIELLIVVAIIGIIVAIAIPNLLAAVQRGRQKRTMADIKTCATTWETYYVDYSYYLPGGGCAVTAEGITLPATALTYSTLIIELQPTYITKLPMNDGWNRVLYFYTDGATPAQAYKIESYGKEGTADSYCGITTSFDNDIVLSNGQFLEWPEGAQQAK